MKLRSVALAAALLATAVTFWGCEWSGGSDNGFNTSRAGLDVNISGFYIGSLSGGKAVSLTSGATISRLVIQQNGNAIEVIDSNGQKYRGTAGAPGALIDLDAVTGAIPAGVNVAQYQIYFSGTDGVAAKQVEFTGIIDVVTVTDVKGDATTKNITSNNQTANTQGSTAGSTSANGNTSTTATTVTTTGTSANTGGETTSIDPETGDIIDSGTALDTTTTGTRTTTDGTTGANTQNRTTTSTATTTIGDGTTTTRTITTTYELTEANTQFRLRGTWIEQGGFVGEVSARATGSGRLVDSTTEGVAGTPAVDTTTN